MLAASNCLPAARLLVTHRRHQPTRPRYRSVAIEPPPLIQFVVLSMLLHMLLIVLFGNPAGSSRRGNEDWFGPLEVILGGRSPEPGSEFRLAPGLETKSPGPALLPRPGATAAPAPSPRRTLEAPATPPAAVETLPRLSPSAPEEVDKPLAPAAPPTVEPLAPLTRPRELTPPVELPLRVPELPAAPIESPVAPRSEPQLAPPVELPQRAVPVAPSSLPRKKSLWATRPSASRAGGVAAGRAAGTSGACGAGRAARAPRAGTHRA